MITPLPGVTTLEAGIGDAAVSRHRARRSATSSGEHGRSRRRAARAHAAVAVDAARHLRRSRALRAASTGASGADGVYFTGDGAKRDEDGYFWLLGRVDDVLNVAGHRIGTMEVESALVDHPTVAEAAVVGTRARDQGPGDRGVRHAEGRRAGVAGSSPTS